jgi:acetoin:2,6-dichlorophenolindophenol oxidoreductase subunit beta
MAKKPFSYALLEGISQEMQKNPLLSCIAQGGLTASLPTGEVIDLAKQFPGPRTSGTWGWPIDEAWYGGWAHGMAAAGMPVIAHLPYMSCLIPFEYIFNNIGKLHYMSGGQVLQNVVLWIDGAARVKGQAGQHTDVGEEALYAYIAGLKIVVPTNAYDAKGLMVSAIRDGNPVCLFDYTDLHAGDPVDVPDDAYTVPIGPSVVRKQGKDITIAAWGPSDIEVNKALPLLTKAGIDIEYVELRTLKPLDTDTLTASVKKTNRLLVVDQGNNTNGFGSHVLAEAAQRVRGALLKKIAFPDAPGPGAQEMIEWMTPTSPKIVDACTRMMKM